MTGEDDFQPRLGRQRSRGKGSVSKPILHRILAAATLARGGAEVSGKRGFTGSRIGRGAGVGRVLAMRDGLAAFRKRRVMIKARIVRLKGKGFEGAKAHLRYIQRDGTTRDGERGELYTAEGDAADRDDFLERGKGDRHQFRFIVSPEDGAGYEDLKRLTRRLMMRMEEDLGTKLDWVAVDHFNTSHPHTHIIVRGKDERGADLVIAKDYISHGMRERACELVDLDLGPRSDQAIEQRLRLEVEQQRFTSVDRMLVREADRGGLMTVSGSDTFQQTIRTGRLRYLERLGLATREGGGWRISPDLAETLRRMGERGDIVRTMQRAYTERGRIAPAPIDQLIFDPAARGVQPLVGRLVTRGLADEAHDRHYLIAEATDGRSHYVAIGKGENVEPLPAAAIVRIVPQVPEVRAADRTVAEVAAAHGGHSVDLHLKHDRTATERFAETHVRRLEAIRRALGTLEREPDGTWIITPDHLEKAAAYEAIRAREVPVRVETLSPVPLERLVDADAATWLDRELAAGSSEPLRDAGFGREVRDALNRRRLWLVEQDLAEEIDGRTNYRPDLLATLRRRELLRAAGQLSGELGLRFVEAEPGARIEGVYRRRVELMGGRYALIEKSREFTLVPWRPALEAQVGKPVSGLMRESGISWTIGRQRGGPTIS